MKCRNILFGLVLISSGMFGDQLVMKSGITLNGNFIGGDSRSVKFVSGDQVKSYQLDQVQSLTFGDSTENGWKKAPGSSPVPNQAIKKLIATDVAIKTLEPIPIGITPGTTIKCELYSDIEQGRETLMKVGDGCSLRTVNIPSSVFNPGGHLVTNVELDTLTIGGKTYHVRSSQKAILPKKKGWIAVFDLMDDVILN